MFRAVFVCVSVAILFGQPTTPSFEVAAIKPSNPDSRNGTLVRFTAGGGLSVANATLKDLIETGYDLRSFQVLGGAPWTAAAKYDVTATSASFPEGASGIAQRQSDRSEVRLKVQALLKDRFQLQVHRETRDVPVYALVISKNGIKAAGLKATNDRAKGINASRGAILGEAASMADLAAKLSSQLARPVENNTGLEGKFNFNLQWTPDLGPSDADDHDSGGPSLFTALSEQLGLRLESRKGKAEVIIIDRVERPSEN